MSDIQIFREAEEEVESNTASVDGDELLCDGLGVNDEED